MTVNLNNFESTTGIYIALIQAYLQKKLELELPQILAIHHLVDVHIRGVRFDSSMDRNLKFYKLALKRRIEYLGTRHENALTLKRRKFPEIDLKNLLQSIAA